LHTNFVAELNLRHKQDFDKQEAQYTDFIADLQAKHKASLE
jgi:hypothetical protein